MGMNLNELDNFQPSLPLQTRYGSLPSGLSLPESDECLFRSVIETYLSEDLSQPISSAHSSTGLQPNASPSLSDSITEGDDERYAFPKDGAWGNGAFGIDIPERDLV